MFFGRPEEPTPRGGVGRRPGRGSGRRPAAPECRGNQRAARPSLPLHAAVAMPRGLWVGLHSHSYAAFVCAFAVRRNDPLPQLLGGALVRRSVCLAASSAASEVKATTRPPTMNRRQAARVMDRAGVSSSGRMGKPNAATPLSSSNRGAKPFLKIVGQPLGLGAFVQSHPCAMRAAACDF